VGSRGISNLAEVVRTVVMKLKESAVNPSSYRNGLARGGYD